MQSPVSKIPDLRLNGYSKLVHELLEDWVGPIALEQNLRHTILYDLRDRRTLWQGS